MGNEIFENNRRRGLQEKKKDIKGKKDVKVGRPYRRGVQTFCTLRTSFISHIRVLYSVDGLYYRISW